MKIEKNNLVLLLREEGDEEITNPQDPSGIGIVQKVSTKSGCQYASECTVILGNGKTKTILVGNLCVIWELSQAQVDEWGPMRAFLEVGLGAIMNMALKNISKPQACFRYRDKVVHIKD